MTSQTDLTSYITATLEGIDTLTTFELRGLKHYALWRSRGVGRKLAGRDHRDLLHEAIVSTLDGTRCWSGRVSLYSHLHGAIRSISNSWSKKNQPEMISICALPYTEDAANALEPESCDPNAEALASANEILNHVYVLFSDDPMATDILRLLENGATPEEVCQRTGISAKGYKAVIKRIRRRLRKTRVFDGILTR